jgi:hypothetical protein
MGHNAKCESHATPLTKCVGTKATNAVDSERKVNLVIVGELFGLPVIKETSDHAIKFCGVEFGCTFNRNEFTIVTHHGWPTHCEM